MKVSNEEERIQRRNTHFSLWKRRLKWSLATFVLWEL